MFPFNMSTPLSEIVKVVHGSGDFSSRLVSLVDREPGERLCAIEGAVLVNERAYTSVQVSEEHDMELKSDLVYCNHSCDPSVIFDTSKLEVRVASDRPLRRSQDVTFFYPSTEWSMTQPFQCNCGSERCLGMIKGAEDLDAGVLGQYWLTPHIRRLLEKRDGTREQGSFDQTRVTHGMVGVKA